MAGKYAHVIAKLPRFLGTEPGHQQKIDAVKEAMVNDPSFKRTAISLGRMYANLRALRDPLKQMESQLQVQIDAVDQLKTEQFEAEGTNSVNIEVEMISDEAIEKFLDELREVIKKSRLNRPQVENVRIQFEPYAQVVDKEAFRKWCLTQGLEAQMSLPWSVTNSLVKAMVENGDPEPPGVKAKAITKTFLSKR